MSKGKKNNFIQKITKTAKTLKNAIKFFAGPIGTYVGWFLIIIFIVILVVVLVTVLGEKVANFFGYTNYKASNEDLAVIQELYNSGYEATIDAENFQDFKAFEYAVLMDAAEYIRITKQEMYDIHKNQNEFQFEYGLLTDPNGKYKDKFEDLKKSWEEEYNMTGDAAVKLLNVSSSTNQDKLSDENLKELIELAKDPSTRNIKVEDYEPSIEEEGTMKGGNNRVSGPYLVYEFVAYDNRSGEEEGLMGSGETISGEPLTSGEFVVSGEKTSGESTTGGSVPELLEAGDMKGSLVPYIYVIREDIEFSYYFDKDYETIKVPLLLNAYNAELTIGKEFGKEASRALYGLSPVIFPDIKGYTEVPCYSDETTYTVYKIPLSTIIGRYMPKQELLMAWSVLKEDVDIEADSKEMDVVEELLLSIKGVYNEACLLNEEKTTVEKIVSGDENDDFVTKTYLYSSPNTHKSSFVTFEKAGIETTKYDINGFRDKTDTVTYATDFVSALLIKDEIQYGYTFSDGISAATTSATKTIATKDLISKYGISGVKLTSYITAGGDPENGYSPPASFNNTEEGYIYSGGEGEISLLENKIREALREKILDDLGYDKNGYPKTSSPGTSLGTSVDPVEVDVSLKGEDIVTYTPIFKTATAEIAKELKIWHTRMPALLVKSATTWARKVTYNHEIEQNIFRQNNEKYIIPKSVSSIGLMGFDTTETGDSGYRGKAFYNIFSRMKEKDVVTMMIELEANGIAGNSDAYEYMRDVYKLVQLAKEYSATSSDGGLIHENTYNYVYIPDSIYYYDDSQTQKIYWLELLAADNVIGDAITRDEIENVRTKDTELTWQVVDYQNYPECQSNGQIRVFALNPFGSAYLRTYVQTAYNISPGVTKSTVFNPDYRAEAHPGADWSGREKINEILLSGEGITTYSQIPSDIYNYELKRYEEIESKIKRGLYPTVDLKTKLDATLKEETINMPIVAVAPGKVTDVGYNARSGFYVEVQHSEAEGISTAYMHLKRWPMVSINDYIGAGTYLGYEGNTGRSFGRHLHFEVRTSASVNPDPFEYIFPTFNPFYNQELASGDKYNLASDYMSLYRTVSMVGTGSGKVSVSSLANNVPTNYLVSDYNNLIVRQGEKEATPSLVGQLDWTEGLASSQTYPEYLLDKGIYDLDLPEVYFDKELAAQMGYLYVPFELLTILYGNIPVKTDLPGALPALTRDELLHILEYWLPARYRNEEDVKWLMENVFTDENIEIMLQAQEKYKVSIVFMLAVAVQECNIGLAHTELSDPPACNIFSIKCGTDVPHILYQGGKTWRKYETYGAAFEGFAKLIAESDHYFTQGRYTIGAIAPVYCEGNTWGNAVTSHALEILQYYIGSSWSFPEGSSLWFGDNSDLINAAKNCFAYSAKNKFSYCQRSCCNRYIPPYKGTPINGDFSGLVPKSRGNVCTAEGGSGRGTTNPKIDCSTYISWVLYEYAKANNMSELQAIAPKCAQSGWYRDVGNYLYNQKILEKTDSEVSKQRVKDFSKYFQLVWYTKRDGNPLDDEERYKSLLQPGDIFASLNSNGQGHVEMYIGAENDTEGFDGWADSASYTGCAVYSCGLYKYRNIPTTYSSEADGIKCVLRPLPPHMVPIE